MVTACASPARAETCVDGICFTERQATGIINLGAYRGGIAVIDYDNDGWMDLVVGDIADNQNRLFRNVQDPARAPARTFVDVTAGSGLDDTEGTDRYCFGMLAIDYDNDGDSDIYSTGAGVGPSFGLLYRNDGGVFTNVSTAAGVRRPLGNPDSCAAADYDLDGHTDIMVIRTVSPWLDLLHNNGDGTFSVANAILPAIPGFSHSYAGAWFDYDRDGWPDCFPISNAGPGTDVLLRNISGGVGGRTFVNVAAAVGYTGLGPAPMGISFGDYDGDLDLDIGVSDGNIGTYYRNNGTSFTEIFPFATMFGWGVSWVDVDNDADLEFYTAGSWGASAINNLQRNNGDGTFSAISDVLNDVARGSQFHVTVDFNNDGLQDLITVNPNHSIAIYENISTVDNHWLTVKLDGDGVEMTRQALNARVFVVAGGRTQVRELVNGSSTTSTEDLRLHFGLADADTVDLIKVVWPRQGTLEQRAEVFYGPFAADQQITLTPTQAACVGDFTGDRIVDNADLQRLLETWAAAGGQAAYDVVVDADSNGTINSADLQALLNNWAEVCP